MSTITPTSTSFSTSALGWGAHEHSWAKSGLPAIGWGAAYAGVAATLALICALALIQPAHTRTDTVTTRFLPTACIAAFVFCAGIYVPSQSKGQTMTHEFAVHLSPTTIATSITVVLLIVLGATAFRARAQYAAASQHSETAAVLAATALRLRAARRGSTYGGEWSAGQLSASYSAAGRIL